MDKKDNGYSTAQIVGIIILMLSILLVLKIVGVAIDGALAGIFLAGAGKGGRAIKRF